MQPGKTYSEAEAKELHGAVALLLEGLHALHGVGHHGDCPGAHLPAPWRVLPGLVPVHAHNLSVLPFAAARTPLVYPGPPGIEFSCLISCLQQVLGDMQLVGSERMLHTICWILAILPDYLAQGHMLSSCTSASSDCGLYTIAYWSHDALTPDVRQQVLTQLHTPQ